MRAGVRVKIWREMRSMREFDASLLARRAGCEKTTVLKYARELLGLGFIELCPGYRYGFRLLRDPVSPPGLPADDARDRAWRSIRVLRVFTIADLERTADISYLNARRYVRSLLLAGVVRLERSNTSGVVGSFKVFRLIRDLGVLAPIVSAEGVLDANSGEVLPPLATGTSPQGRGESESGTP